MFNIGRQGNANIINESGLFTLILRSREALDAARNFVAAYALEGERLPGDIVAGDFPLTHKQAIRLAHLLHSADWVNFRWNQGISEGLMHLNRELWSGMAEHMKDMAREAGTLDKELRARLKAEEERVRADGLGGLRPHDYFAKHGHA